MILTIGPGRALWGKATVLAGTVTSAILAGVFATRISDTPGIVLIFILVPVAAIHYILAVRRSGLTTPDGIFYVSQLLMAFGTFVLTDHGSAVDRQYSNLVAGSTLAYIIASLTTFLVLTKARKTRLQSYRVDLVAPGRKFMALLLLSAAVVATYFVAVGYSAFLIGLQGQIDGRHADVATLRLDSYAGARYLFPGYVNQFKNAILPSLSLVFATWAFSRSSLVPKFLAVLSLAFAALALVWTGQRGAFVSFSLTATLYAYLCNHRRISSRVLAIPMLALPLLLVSTVVLGRDKTAAGGILVRFLNDNQQSGIYAYRYTSRLHTQWGHEWATGLLGILPGNRGSSLNGEVFATVFGTTRGTMPPSLWGSLHYNFDSIGALIGAVLLGVLLQRWTIRSWQGDRYNSIQLVGYSGAAVVIGTWVSDGPTTLLNGGLVAYIVLWYWGRGVSRRHAIAKDERHGKPSVDAGPSLISTASRTGRGSLIATNAGSPNCR